MGATRKLVAVLCGVGLVACGDGEDGRVREEVLAPAFAKSQAPIVDVAAAAAYLDEVNADLAAAGAAYRVERAEYSLKKGTRADEASVVFANDRTLRLTSRWVPNDPRRNAAGTTLTQGTFQPLATSSTGVDLEAPVDASFETWNDVQCSKLSIVKREIPAGVFPSAIVGYGGLVNDPFVVDIATLGFLPGAFFDIFLGPGASDVVLAVTFTFVFLDGPGGDPSDIDGDGRDDTALKEVWYNDAFLWSTTGGPGVDVETVALHENGHALELGHFGKIHATGNKLHTSPRAVMNAIILGTLRSPLGTDNGAYCGNFASWPN